MVTGIIEEARSRAGEIRVTLVDITKEPGVAAKYRAMATPAIAINGRLEFTGLPKRERLMERLLQAASR